MAEIEFGEALTVYNTFEEAWNYAMAVNSSEIEEYFHTVEIKVNEV